MKLGDQNKAGLTSTQKRLVVALAVGVAVIVSLSSLSHFTYREVRALVVGNTVTLTSRSDGRIARILVRENEPFTAGAPLVELQNQALGGEIESVEREVNEVRRAVTLERSGLGLERRIYDLETTFADAKSKLAAARIGIEGIDHLLPGMERAHEEARERFERTDALVAAGAMTLAEQGVRRGSYLEAERDYQEILGRRRVLQAEIQNYERLLALHDRRLETLGHDRGRTINDLEITLVEKERELARLHELWKELTVIATDDGLVTAVHRRPGEYVPAGDPILSVMTSDALWVELYLPPDEKQSVQQGDRVYIDDPSGGSRLSGRISAILPVLRPFPNSADRLGIGNGHFAVLRVVFDDGELARVRLSPSQEVHAKIRRRWVPVANAESQTRP